MTIPLFLLLINLQMTCRILDFAFIFLPLLLCDIKRYKRMREGIAHVKILGGESDAIKHVIFGGKAPSHNPHEVNKDIQFFAQRLNEPQKEAIKFCLASNGIPNIHCYFYF